MTWSATRSTQSGGPRTELLLFPEVEVLEKLEVERHLPEHVRFRVEESKRRAHNRGRAVIQSVERWEAARQLPQHHQRVIITDLPHPAQAFTTQVDPPPALERAHRSPERARPWRTPRYCGERLEDTTGAPR